MIEDGQRFQVILVDGATGYLGSHLTHYLSKTGSSVRCLIRSQSKAEDVAILQSCGAQIYKASLMQPSLTLDESFDGVDVAVHLIGSIAPKKGETFSNLHVEQTKKFADMCTKKVKKIVMITACGAKPDALSEYHRTKWLAEEVVRNSGLNCIFIRPSLLIGCTFGSRHSKLVKRFAELIKTRRAVPLIGSGENKIQPLFIDDLVVAIAKCIRSYPANVGDLAPIFELGGPEVITMKQFVQMLMQMMGYQKSFLSIPIPVAYMIATLAQAFQEIPVLSLDQVKLSTIDNICLRNDLVSKLSITPHSVSEALKSYQKKADMILSAGHPE